MGRIVQPELLDTLPPDDPSAVRSRRDLRRVNAWMGNHRIMAAALKANAGGTSKQITELGAGDGHFLLRVAGKTGWRDRNASLLDLQKNISAETIAAFTRLGWNAQAIVDDVFAWDGAADIVVANLFLHHFDDARLRELLQKISGRTRLFIAVEPHRFAFPAVCGHLLRLIGCNTVTRHDGTISVRAGFIDRELSALWPNQGRWQLVERRAGWFSHLFIAKKIS